MSDKDTSFERFSSFDTLYDASYKICRNVRWKDSTIDFEEHRIETILKTEADLRNHEYQQLVFNCFSIIERGKRRDIRACHINDRLVQNALCEESLLPELTPKFIYDNCATLKNKGIDFALNRIKLHLRQAHKEYGLGKDFYGLRIDIRKYFDSIDHEALKHIASKVIKDKEIYSLVCYLIETFSFQQTTDKQPVPGKTYYKANGHKYIKISPSHFKPNYKYYEQINKSLGLGSQTSQLFALLTLNEIDHFIKEQLHIKYYGRYMDDLYLLHDSKEYLLYCLKQIELKLEAIGLRINPNKTIISLIHPIGEDKKRKNPFKYLKWNFYITNTNKLIMLPFKEKLTKERRRLRKMSVLWKQGKISTEDVQLSYTTWREHISKGNTYYIRQKMDNYFHQLFQGVDI